MREFAILSGWMLAVAAVYVAGARWRTRRRSRERLLESVGAGRPLPVAAGDLPGDSGLRHWLTIAGIRRRGAAQLFVGACALSVLAAVILTSVVLHFGLVGWGMALVAAIPGAPGDVLRGTMYAAPWLLLVMVASIPWLYVRGCRRKQVREVQRDLPISLELLATLGEAGLGFEAAINRLLESHSLDRPLAREFRQLQLEALAGVPRVHCLRRLSRRVEVSSVSIFISALVQAEQVGAGMAEVLRRQADDLRNRRREAALAVAQSVPVKLTFPLVICFLPGIFVTTLGPTFYQFFQLADNVMRRAQ